MKLRRQIARLVHLLFRSCGLERWLGLFNFTVPVSHGGFEYLVPVREDRGIGLSTPPPAWADHLYARFLPKISGIFLDVGCNLGQSFLLWYKHRASGSRYVGVDPQPRCCDYVATLARKNGIPDSVVFCAGLGASMRIAVLHCIDEAGGDSDMASMEVSLRSEANYQSRVLVPTVTGDDLVASLTDPLSLGMIKIDVEGFEHEVLLGFGETIARDRPLILCEFMAGCHPDPAQRENRRKGIESSNSFLKSNGYEVLHARHDGGFDLIEAIPAKELTPADYATGYDFLLVPEEKRACLFPEVQTERSHPAVQG